MIVLTAVDADKVRGLSPHRAGHGLMPVPLKDGTFMLPEEVLEDEAHADVREFLEALPMQDVAKLPIYTEDDEAPVSELKEPLSLRSDKQAQDRAAALATKTAVRK